MIGACISLLILMLRCALPVAMAPLTSKVVVWRAKQGLGSVKRVGSDRRRFAFCAASKRTTCLPQALEPGMLWHCTVKPKGDGGRSCCGCFSGTSHCGSLCGLCTLPEQQVTQFLLKWLEEGVTQKPRGNWARKHFLQAF